MSSTEISPQHGPTKLGVKDRESLRRGYEKIIQGLIGLIVAMILLILVSFISFEYILERRSGGVLLAPIIAVLYSTISLGEGSLKLKKPLYILPVALTGMGFLLYSGAMILLFINPSLILEENILFVIILMPRLGVLGLASLFLLMFKDLIDQHKILALIATIIAFIGVAVYADISAIIASIIMVYNLYSLRKRL